MSKSRKKPTNMELIQMIQMTNMKIDEVNKSINTVGQTLSDFIEFNKEGDTFLEYLKTKYKTSEDEKKE